MATASLPTIRLPGTSLIPVQGFSATELMVALAIIASLAALAAPGFGGIVERYRLLRATQDLSESIYLARSEAIRRGGRVTLRKTSPAGCATGRNKDWSCGWAVFADTNDNGTRDAGEEEIRTSPIPEGVETTLRAGGSGAYLKVDRWGQLNGLGAFSIVLRPRNNPDPEAARTLCVTAGGRLKSLQGTDACQR